MKNKILSVILVFTMIFLLAACDTGGAQSVVDAVSQVDQEVASLIGDGSDDEDIVTEIPDAIKNLSEEDDILLNGELKDGVYINKYFGYKFTAPEGFPLTREYDGATESDQIIPLAQAYEGGDEGLVFSAFSDDKGYVLIIVKAIRNDDIGMDEEALVRNYIQRMLDIYGVLDEAAAEDDTETSEEESRPEYSTEVLCGEEHPISFLRSGEGENVKIMVDFCIPKGDFEYDISISVPEALYEDILKCFEKI